jgi:hypothetical protein
MEILDFSITGRLNAGTAASVRHLINQVLDSFTSCKIGKTGNYESRAAKYKSDGFKNMVLVYESSSIKYVEEFEKLFIKEFYNRVKNIHMGSAGIMSYSGTYHLYVVGKKKKPSKRK